MTTATPFGPNDPQKALLNLRIIWAVMQTSVIVFMFIVIAQQTAGSPHQPALQTMNVMIGMSWAMLATIVPVGYFVRMQVYKRSWQGDVIAPAGYTIGNLVLFACCHSVAFFALILVMLNGTLWPTIIPTVLAMAVMVINFPNGHAMHPRDTLEDVT
jgi:hypothetical protein